MTAGPLGVGDVNDDGARIGSVIWERADDGTLIARVCLGQ